jgi:dUTP pyrophosphatase
MNDQSNGTVEIPTLIEDEEFLPFYMSTGAAGADVKASLKEPLIVPPGKSALIPTGLRLAIPEGYEIQIRPRSGLALKHQVTLLNSPATIDSDYRGEVKVILINHGTQEFAITPGMRIAQFILAPVFKANFVICSELTTTGRGMGGFGHTGS